MNSRVLVRRWELPLTLGLGTANVAAELAGEGKGVVLVVGGCLWGWYFLLRQQAEPGFWHSWFVVHQPRGAGMWLLVLGTTVAVALCLAVGVVTGGGRLEPWLVAMLAVYTPWGLVQQFFLQEVLARQLDAHLPRRGKALAVGLFAAAHLPDAAVAAVVLPAAAFWVWVYPKVGSLLPLALSHALMGTAFFAGVQGRTWHEAVVLTLR
ncbi:MAG: hypothetical protein NZ869_00520 [Thermoanaerobaculum sp.]|nr:hypothetical protein [Thermoanaerobaculum sp.]MDW7966651.1 hypothetical protein [Thermoanaerobaculum sp.]